MTESKNNTSPQNRLSRFLEGFGRLYAPIRRRLPRRPVYYNNTPIAEGRLFDRTLNRLPWINAPADRPAYESTIINGLKRYLEVGDRVVVVGGGWGVTATVAAEQVSPDGEVIVYEAGVNSVEMTRSTLRLNGFSQITQVHHAIVGEGVNLPGELGNPQRISADQLPECDLLELDCEGSELNILESMTIKPEVVLVETHGVWGSPSNKVEQLLESLSYEVLSREIADPGSREECLQNDIFVLTGIRR